MTRTVPTVALENPGVVVASALWNSGPKATADFMTGPPMFRGHQATVQSGANNTYAPMKMDVTDVDTDSGHSTVTNNSRYTCQVAGWYIVGGFTCWTNTGGSTRVDVLIAKNGAAVDGTHVATRKPNVDYGALGTKTILQLAVGDYVEVWGMQNTGSTMNTFDGADICPSLTALWVHA